MLDKIKERREDLKAELAQGQSQLDELERRARSLRETLQRISGAIQVLDDVIAEEEKQGAR